MTKKYWQIWLPQYTAVHCRGHPALSQEWKLGPIRIFSSRHWQIAINHQFKFGFMTWIELAVAGGDEFGCDRKRKVYSGPGDLQIVYHYLLQNWRVSLNFWSWKLILICVLSVVLQLMFSLGSHCSILGFDRVGSRCSKLDFDSLCYTANVYVLMTTAIQIKVVGQ